MTPSHFPLHTRIENDNSDLAGSTALTTGLLSIALKNACQSFTRFRFPVPNTGLNVPPDADNSIFGVQATVIKRSRSLITPITKAFSGEVSCGSNVFPGTVTPGSPLAPGTGSGCAPGIPGVDPPGVLMPNMIPAVIPPTSRSTVAATATAVFKCFPAARVRVRFVRSVPLLPYGSAPRTRSASIFFIASFIISLFISSILPFSAARPIYLLSASVSSSPRSHSFRTRRQYRSPCPRTSIF